MDDVISRQAVISMVNDWTYDLCDPEDEWAAIHDVKALPSAQPEIIRCIKELEIELRAVRSVLKETINENLDLHAKLIKLETKVIMLERGITLTEGDE